MCICEVHAIARKVKVQTNKVSEICIAHNLHARMKRGENSTANCKFKEGQLHALAVEYQAGLGLDYLAKKYGCGTGAVRHALVRAGVQIKKKGGAISPFSKDPEFRTKVKILWDQGMSQTAIGKALGCCQGVISRVLVHHFGISTKRSGAAHHSWKGGRLINVYGYASVALARTHPLASMRSVDC